MNKQQPISRRRFLKRACVTGGALALAGLINPLPLAARAGGIAPRSEQQSRLLMGTIVTLTAVTDDPGLAGAGFEAAFAEMERLIALFDRHDSGSALSLLNASGSLEAAPPELGLVLARARELGLASDHAFNPAIAPVVDLFEARRGRLPGYGDKDFKEALALAEPGEIVLGARGVRLGRAGMKLTLDGIAKGYIADKASERLCALGLANHMVNAGGDIRCSGRPAPGRAWQIGIQHPGRAGALLATAAVSSGGIATSGSYEAYYDRARSRHHLISHLTGKSADIASVSVRAASAMEADALATALAFMPPALALRFAEENKAACLVADSSGRLHRSPGWI